MADGGKGEVRYCGGGEGETLTGKDGGGTSQAVLSGVLDGSV